MYIPPSTPSSTPITSTPEPAKQEKQEKQEKQRSRRIQQYVPTTPMQESVEPAAKSAMAGPPASGKKGSKQIQPIVLASSLSVAQTMQETKEAIAASNKVLEGLKESKPSDDHLDAVSAESFFASHTTLSPPVSNPPVSNPPISNLPFENPPIATLPISTPPVSNPPISTPPISTPPISTPPFENPPISTPPISNPPISTPPFANPPFENPPFENPPVPSPVSLAPPPASSLPEPSTPHIQPFVPLKNVQQASSIHAPLHFSIGGYRCTTSALDRIPNAQDGSLYDLQTFPGPLTQGKKREKALQYCQSQIAYCNNEDWKLLWGVLSILIESNGVVNAGRS